MLTNADLAELFARRAETAEGHRAKAYRRASREAMAWEDEITQVEDYTTLAGIGPSLAKRIESWLDDPPPELERPRMRQGFLSMTEAKQIVGEDPGFRNGLRSDLHMHTTYSDGLCSVAEMAAAAHERGYEYIAITDHSGGQRIPSGMHAEDIDRQHKEIKTSKLDLPVLRGIEMNLGVDGSSDTDSKVLARLDIVLGSFHSKLRISEDQTKRYLSALLNPDIQVLGHPQGRKYDMRHGLNADWQKVVDAATLLDKALEIDSNPNRQDVSAEILALAAESGTRISIGTDAHAPEEMRFMSYGLAAALRAGISKDRILNFMPADDLCDWVSGVRRGKSKS